MIAQVLVLVLKSPWTRCPASLLHQNGSHLNLDFCDQDYFPQQDVARSNWDVPRSLFGLVGPPALLCLWIPSCYLDKKIFFVPRADRKLLLPRLVRGDLLRFPYEILDQSLLCS